MKRPSRAAVLRATVYALTGLALILRPFGWPPGAPSADLIAVAAGAACCTAALLALLGPGARRSGRSAKRSSGPRRTDFTPLGFLGRSPLDAVVCAALVAAGIASAAPGAAALPLTMTVLGVLLGYHGWRRRSVKPWLQLTLSTGLPLLLAALFVSVSNDASRLGVLLTFLPAAGLGSSLGALAEHASGRRPSRLLRAAWRGVAFVEDRADDAPARFDIRPLLRPVPRSEAREAATRIPNSRQRAGALVQRTLFLVGAPLILVLIPTAFGDEKYVTGADAPSQITGMAAFFSLLILGYSIIGVIGFRSWSQTTSAADHVRLIGFAAANGFEYLPGPVADTGRGVLTRVLRSRHGWLLANASKSHDQTAGSAAPVTMFSGFSEFRLPVPLPHLLLLRRGIRAPVFSAYRAPLPGQRIRLEGNFNRFFDVYCPRGYETDALYLLTPDVMAALIDGARRFDVEIIDDRLILRSRRDLVTVDPGVWLGIATAVGALQGRTLQWKRWRDDRRESLGEAPRLQADRPTGAALAGRRLRGGIGLGLVFALGYGALYLGLVLISNSL